ncbi:MAG: methionyl-tRNA formyltransferase [Polaromonas sp.]|nr:methionyl-tRNA formyltransferase [Polaromonas sp.]
MRLIFAGTPEFARVAAQSLYAAGFNIALVLTQPDRPAGRGMKLQSSSVKQWALDHQIPVTQPRSLRLEGKYPSDATAARQAILDADADAMVVAAYGLILPQWVLSTPRLGCFNIHASLLPRWRGAAPIHRAIEAGDTQTGITIMQMDAGLDTGDMLAVETVPIALSDSTDTLHDTLAELGGRLMVRVLETAGRSGLSPVPQPEAGVTYAAKIEKREAALDWTLPATLLAQRIRAFTPFPGASAVMRGEVIKLWAAQVLGGLPTGTLPGQVLAAGPGGLDIATLDGVLRVTRLQKAGGKTLDVADFLRGFDIESGMVFAPSSVTSTGAP